MTCGVCGENSTARDQGSRVAGRPAAFEAAGNDESEDVGSPLPDALGRQRARGRRLRVEVRACGGGKPRVEKPENQIPSKGRATSRASGAQRAAERAPCNQTGERGSGWAGWLDQATAVTPKAQPAQCFKFLDEEVHLLSTHPEFPSCPVRRL